MRLPKQAAPPLALPRDESRPNFVQTRWSLIQRVQAGGDETAVALGELCKARCEEVASMQYENEDVDEELAHLLRALEA